MQTFKLSDLKKAQDKTGVGISEIFGELAEIFGKDKTHISSL